MKSKNLEHTFNWNQLLKKGVLFFIHVYQKLISPVIHFVSGPTAGCRFVPSCSHYTEQAIKKYGVWKGTRMGAKRICKCHPFGSSGYDPVK
jgi:putative membrane protein insertion efficiency factor